MKNPDPDISILIAQYETVWRSIEYLDGNILKALSIYGVLGGVLIANIERFYTNQWLAIIIIGFVGFVFFLFLVRTKLLIDEQVKTINQLEEEICKVGNSIRTFPSKFGKGLRTSLIGTICVALITIGAMLSIAFRW